MAGDFAEVELLLISDWKSKDGTKQQKLRVVQWIKEGKSIAVLLEKREYYQEEGSMKMGKANGLGLKDFEKLKEHYPRMMALMQSPPPPPGPLAAEPEEAPF